MLRGPRQAIKRVEQSTFSENRGLLIEYDVTMGCLTKRRDGSTVARLPVGREFQHTRHADSGVSRPQSLFAREQIERRYTSPLAGMCYRENWHGAKLGARRTNRARTTGPSCFSRAGTTSFPDNTATRSRSWRWRFLLNNHRLRTSDVSHTNGH